MATAVRGVTSKTGSAKLGAMVPAGAARAGILAVLFGWFWCLVRLIGNLDEDWKRRTCVGGRKGGKGGEVGGFI